MVDGLSTCPSRVLLRLHAEAKIGTVAAADNGTGADTGHEVASGRQCW